MTDIAAIADGLSEAQRFCGDATDSFPCVACKAKGSKGCPLPPSATIPLRDLINGTPGLGNYLREEIGKSRAYLMSMENRDER